MTKPAILPDTDAEPKTRRHRKPVEELTTAERVARAGVALETARELLAGLDPGIFGGAVGNIASEAKKLQELRDRYEAARIAMGIALAEALDCGPVEDAILRLAELLGID